jgi:type II secretory pathway component PulF
MIQQRYGAGEVHSLVRASLLRWGAVATAFCAIPSAAIFAAVPKFEALLVGFGADLPQSTQVFLDWPYLIWAFPALTFLLFCTALAMPAEMAVASHRRMVAAFAVLSVLSMVAEGLAAFALYAPFFFMGQVV